jgi:hypothetical protein
MMKNWTQTRGWKMCESPVTRKKIAVSFWTRISIPVV